MQQLQDGEVEASLCPHGEPRFCKPGGDLKHRV